MLNIKIFTDGGARPNPGLGGFGIYSKELNISFSFGCEMATNNQMELLAVIYALKYIKDKNLSGNFEIITDSNYCVQGLNSWIDGWRKKRWAGVKNSELWQILDKLFSEQKNTKISWIKAHVGHEGNEIADSLATNGVMSKSKNQINHYIKILNLNNVGDFNEC